MFSYRKFNKRMDDHFDKIVDNVFDSLESFPNIKAPYFMQIESTGDGCRIEESEDSHTIHIAAPGHSAESISVEVNGNYLMIKADSIKDDPFSEDIAFRFSIPSYLDKSAIEAEVRNGVISVKIAVKKADEKPSYKVKVK